MPDTAPEPENQLVSDHAKKQADPTKSTTTSTTPETSEEQSSSGTEQSSTASSNQTPAPNTSESNDTEKIPHSTDTEKQPEGQSQSNQDDNEEAAGDTEQLVVFQLAGELYAAPILDVQEIIPYTEVTPIPNVADYIEGIINVRGTVATIINLSRKFNLKQTNEHTNQYIVLTRIKKSLLGMMVDEVTSVIKVPTTEIKSANTADSQIHTDYIKGVVVVNQKVILILDFSQILAQEEIEELASDQNQTANTSWQFFKSSLFSLLS